MKFKTLAEAHAAFAEQSDALAAANQNVENLMADLQAMTAARDAAQLAAQTAIDERNALQAQFDDHVASATALRADLETATARITELDGQVSTLTTERDTALANVDRISQLAGVRGIDPASAISAPASAQAQENDAALLEKYSKLQGRERTEFFRANKAALLRAGAAV